MADGFQGSAIAARIVERLRAKGLTASARELPPWPSFTHEVGTIILVEVRGVPRAVALSETWHVHAYGPPTVPHPRWQWDAKVFPIGEPSTVPVETVVEGVASFVRGFAEGDASLGLLDIILWLLDALPAVDGGWRAYVNDGTAWVGLDRGRRRWPLFLQVGTQGQGFEIGFRGAGRDDDEKRWRVRMQTDLERVVGEVGEAVTRLALWCQGYVAQRTLLERFALQLALELDATLLPPAGFWTASTPSSDTFGARARPAASVRWGDEGMAGSCILTVNESGQLVALGAAYPDDTPMSVLAQAVAANARKTFTPRLGDRYLLKREIAGFAPGTLVRFVESQCARNDVTHWRFDVMDGGEDVAGARAQSRHGTIRLSDGSTEDAAVMAATGDWFEAVEDTFDPAGAKARRVEALAGAGRYLRENGALVPARARLEEACQLDPGHAMTMFQLGWIAAQQDRWTDALIFFSRAAELDPASVDAKNNTAWALGRLGRWGESLGILDALAASNPGFACGHRNRGWVLRNLGRLEAAEEACSRALALNPEYADALHEKGLVAVARGRLRDAVVSLERAAALAPEDANIRATLEKARAG